MPTAARKSPDTPEQPPEPEPVAAAEPELVTVVFQAQCPLVIDGFGELTPGQEIALAPDRAAALIKTSPFFSRA